VRRRSRHEPTLSVSAKGHSEQAPLVSTHSLNVILSPPEADEGPLPNLGLAMSSALLRIHAALAQKKVFLVSTPSLSTIDDLF
jgi:hypothetical protein